MRTSCRLGVLLQSIIVSTLSGCGGSAEGGQPATFSSGGADPGVGGVRRGERSPWEALAAECKQAAVAREQLRGQSKRGLLAPVERALGEWELAVVA